MVCCADIRVGEWVDWLGASDLVTRQAISMVCIAGSTSAAETLNAGSVFSSANEHIGRCLYE